MTSLTATWRGRVTANAMDSAMSWLCSISIGPKVARIPSITSGRLCVASSVITAPGSMTDTRTWRRVTSWRNDSENATTPTVSYTHLRAHETDSYLVCRLLLE